MEKCVLSSSRPISSTNPSKIGYVHDIAPLLWKLQVIAGDAKTAFFERFMLPDVVSTSYFVNVVSFTFIKTYL